MSDKSYPPSRHGISPEVWRTFCAISDPKNEHAFTKEAAHKAFQHVQGDGDPDVQTEKLTEGREEIYDANRTF